jgi:hypothetical protein
MPFCWSFEVSQESKSAVAFVSFFGNFGTSLTTKPLPLAGRFVGIEYACSSRFSHLLWTITCGNLASFDARGKSEDTNAMIRSGFGFQP